VTRVWDVLVITSSGYMDSPADIRASEKPFRDCLPLDDAVAFHRLEHPLSEAIMDACEPRELDTQRRVRQYAQLVSLVRQSPPEPHQDDWDPDRRIYKALGVSRLVQPTPVGLEYTARVRARPDGTAKQIVPGPVQGREAYAFCSPGRRYLTEQDAQTIKKLLPQYNPHSFPQRVKRALWRFDYAFYEYYIDFRWLFVSAAMEALIHTDPYRSTAQFCARLAALASKVNLTQWTEQKLRSLYRDYRCAVAHGQDIRKADPKTIEDYAKFEDLVRAILLRCVEDEAFREIFSSDESIRTHLPV